MEKSGRTVIDMLTGAWPAQGIGAAMPESYGASAPVFDPVAKALIGAATLPKRVMDANAKMVTTGQYDPSPFLEAAALPMGTGAIAGLPLRAGEAVLGSGFVRKIPADNYTGAISRYTPTLYREMSPSEALVDLPTSVSYASNPFGNRKFYADTPDLALGQGSNRGVRVEYDSGPFEGQINQQKPAWEMAFQKGSAEYLASPKHGQNIRDSVKGFEIDPKSLSWVEKAQYERLLNNLEAAGWEIKRGDKIVAKRPPESREGQ